MACRKDDFDKPPCFLSSGEPARYFGKGVFFADMTLPESWDLKSLGETGDPTKNLPKKQIHSPFLFGSGSNR